jgi:hypothetical protein
VGDSSPLLDRAEIEEAFWRSVSHLSRAQQSIAFGMLLEPLDEPDRAVTMRVLPTPVRLLYPILIDRPWKKYAATLRGKP